MYATDLQTLRTRLHIKNDFHTYCAKAGGAFFLDSYFQGASVLSSFGSGGLCPPPANPVADPGFAKGADHGER